MPQSGSFAEPGWTDPARHRRVACLGLIDPATGRRWLFDATPDFPSQLRDLSLAAGLRAAPAPVLDGIFLTHAHIGHYAGLIHLGREVMGTRAIAVHAMPRMRQFLESSGPWSQLVSLGNISLSTLHEGEPVQLTPALSVTPILVPHRQEFSEVVGFRIDGPRRRALFIPDIDSWEQWDALGTRLEDALAAVDVAYLDGTFFSGHELPPLVARSVPHPFIEHTLDRLKTLPEAERRKVRFIHLNHTNPALWVDTAEHARIEQSSMSVADEGETTGL